jgi:dTDP-4-amino-4,6-dideoxygalactose transaminase
VSQPVIQVWHPLLPSTDAIARYMSLLDRSRRYTNHGALVTILEERLAVLFKMPATSRPVTAASGTAALTAAILATAGRATEARPLCLCPAYTFTATALAAELCNYRVHFVDVDERSWALDAETLALHPLIARTGVVVVTAPYGRRFSQAAWERFRERTGVPVVIDAAASVEALADDSTDLVGNVPLVLSMHATKVFGVGEGGAVLCNDPVLVRAAAAALNFGFDDVRETTGPGFNGKMSEYHAAVGLAELDGWAAKRIALRRVADCYRDAALARGLRLHTDPEVSACYILLETATLPEAEAARGSLREAAIDHRLWYGPGLHRERYFSTHTRDPLPVVEDLAPRLIGLPVAHDLADASIERVIAAVAAFGIRH